MYTCNSDHSLARCLFYGAGATPIGSVCEHQHSDRPYPQMCALSGVPCNLHIHFTCHHRSPLSNYDITPTNAKRIQNT